MRLERLEQRYQLSAPAFNAPADYSQGFSYADFVASGDFNGDGHADLVTEDANGDISVFLGNGNGTLAPPVNTFLETHISSIQVANLIPNGPADIIVASGLHHNIEILLGNGDGTFQSPEIYNLPSFSGAPAVGDLNGDGIPDIAVACYSPQEVTILTGNGDGSFATTSPIPLNEWSNGITIADVNNDGLGDLVLTYNDGIGVMDGQGGGQFAAQQFYSIAGGAEIIDAADLTGNGIPDLVFSTRSADIGVMLANADYTYQSPVYYNTVLAFGLSVADVNGDNIQDIVASGFSSTATLLVGNGDGTFVPQSVGTGEISDAIPVDLSSDGLSSVVGAFGNLAVATNAAPDNVAPFAVLSNGVLTIFGTSGNDVIHVSQSGNTVTATLNYQTPETFNQPIHQIDINAGAGNDTVTVASNVHIAASIHGGGGDDSIVGGAGNDTIFGDGGSDTILGAVGNDSLVGGGENDILRGNAGNDTLWGGWGNDTLSGGAEHNLIFGKAGDDLIYSAVAAVDTIYGGLGNDTVHALGTDTYPNHDITDILDS